MKDSFYLWEFITKNKNKLTKFEYQHFVIRNETADPGKKISMAAKTM